MRQFLRTILRILDGSPNYTMATRNRQRGQSMLELAFITPLLAILIAGAVEVGWYTNRWLSLLEITRVGARSATFLQGDLSPLQWTNEASIHPDIWKTYYGLSDGDYEVQQATNARECVTGSNYGFYSFIACIMETSLQPLEFNMVNGQDDIVISVFAIQPVNNADFRGTEPNEEGDDSRPIFYRFSPQAATQISPTSDEYKITFDLNDTAQRDDYPPGLQSIVVGRYPTNANECTRETTTTDALPANPSFEHDPFDYLVVGDGSPGLVTVNPHTSEEYVLEVRAEDGTRLSDEEREYQRGFSFLGQHRVDDPNVYCYGSEFSIREVEQLINMPDFIEPDLYNPPPTTPATPYEDWVNAVYDSQNERRFFEPQGITLVEVFWEHDLLLNFPLFRPLQEAYDDVMVIALWSAFPLPSSAPNITYQLP